MTGSLTREGPKISFSLLLATAGSLSGEGASGDWEPSPLIPLPEGEGAPTRLRRLPILSPDPSPRGRGCSTRLRRSRTPSPLTPRPEGEGALLASGDCRDYRYFIPLAQLR